MLFTCSLLKAHLLSRILQILRASVLMANKLYEKDRNAKKFPGAHIKLGRSTIQELIAPPNTGIVSALSDMVTD